MPTHHRTHEVTERLIEERIASAIEMLLATRDCCGDEREALRDIEDNDGAFTAGQRAAVRSGLEQRWSGDQSAAGVSQPIDSDERMRVNRDLAEDDTSETRPRFEGWGDMGRHDDD